MSTILDYFYASSPSLFLFVTGADGGEICGYCRNTEEAHASGTLGQTIAYFSGDNTKSRKRRRNKRIRQKYSENLPVFTWHADWAASLCSWGGPLDSPSEHILCSLKIILITTSPVPTGKYRGNFSFRSRLILRKSFLFIFCTTLLIIKAIRCDTNITV